MKHRVAVTGMGVVSPLGMTVDEFRDALLAGRSGVRTITVFDPASLPTRIAAEVTWNGEPILRDRKVTFAIAAARSGVRRPRTARRHRRRRAEPRPRPRALLDARPRRETAAASPERLVLQTPSDLGVPADLSELGLTAPPMTHVSACAAGTDAIGHAFRMIATGRRRWMVAGGADSMINPLGVAGFCSIGATTTANDPPARASRPFDRRRSGFVLGEGAGMLILERFEDARARGATIHAEICGYGELVRRARHQRAASRRHGARSRRCRARWPRRGSTPSEVDCINAHGTSTPKNDPVETLAIKRLLGARARARAGLRARSR